MNCTSNLIPPDSRLKTNDEACLSCFGEMSSLIDHQEIVQNKQIEILKRKMSDSSKYEQKSLGITETVKPHSKPYKRTMAITKTLITRHENIELVSELKKPNGHFGCRFCDRDFSRPNYVLKHMKVAHGKTMHECEMCGKEFRYKAEVDEHEATHRRDAQTSRMITKTVIPHPEHDNQNHIPSRSIISMDAEITITEEENGETAIDLEIVEGISDLRRPSGYFGCRFCKREFSAPNYAIKHMQDMHGKLLHKCDVCSKEFRQKAEVDKHRATHLRDEPLPYPCSSCPQSFKTFEEFQDHSRTHQMMKKFGCAQCGRRFKDEAKLHKHMINHNTNPYSCQRCKKTFRSKHTYLKHRKMHGDNQKFTCDLCNKHFSSAESLHMHLKNHSKPYR